MQEVAISSIRLNREQQLLPPRLNAACQFLVRQEVPRGGWPRYEGGPISLYHTALVACALSAADPSKYSGQIAQAVYNARATFGNDLASLETNELAYLIWVSGAERTPDKPWMFNLGTQLMKWMRNDLGHPERILVREFSTWLVALSRAGAADAELIDKCVKRLWELEVSGKGSWTVGSDGKPSAMATAYAIRALTKVDQARSASAIQRGTKYLEAEVAEHGWQSLGIGSGTFAQATVLSALAAFGTPERIEQGITVLQEAVNSDGGWGGGPGEPSTIEATAIALEALLACDENRFVPYRVAAASLTDVTARCDTLESELANLRRDVEDQVSKRCEKIVEDRDALRREADRLRKIEKDLRREIESVQRNALEESRRSQMIMRLLAQETGASRFASTYARIIGLLIPVNVLALGLLIWSNNVYIISDWLGIPINSRVIGALLIAFSLFGFYSTFHNNYTRTRILKSAIRRGSLADEVHGHTVSSAVVEFSEIMSGSGMGPEVQEEITYLMIGRISEMSPDIGMKHLQSLLLHLDVPASARKLLSRWTEKFLDMSPFERRAIVEQIRRLSLIR